MTENPRPAKRIECLSGPAPQINQAAGDAEFFIEGLSVGLKERVALEVSILVGCQARRMRILPQRRINTVGQPPSRRNPCEVHECVTLCELRPQARASCGRALMNQRTESDPNMRMARERSLGLPPKP